MSDGPPHYYLAEVLARHGLPGAVAQRVEGVGLELWALQQEHGVEFAAMLDAETGDSLAPYIRGEATSVVTAAHDATRAPVRPDPLAPVRRDVQRR